MLTTPVRSGFVLTRRRLAAADATGAGHRIGERRFTLRALLDQAPDETLSWLSGEAARWSARHEDRGPAGDIVLAWWARRAARTAQVLAAGTAARPGPRGPGEPAPVTARHLGYRLAAAGASGS
jgi:hypothetical protein